MKKIFLGIMISIMMLFSGCTMLKLDSADSTKTALKAIDLAYSTGDYRIVDAAFSGFITSSRKSLLLEIPVSKKFLEGQTVIVTSIERAEIRANGTYVGGYQADLTPFIHSADIQNDGALLQVRLENENKWTNSDGAAIPNNVPVAGYLTINFEVFDP